MITDHPQKVYTRLRELRIDPYALILLGVAARLLICLAAIWMGMFIAVRGSELIAVCAALACGGVIYGLLGKERKEIDCTTDRIYTVRGPLGTVWRLHGDEALDRWYDAKGKDHVRS